MMPRPAATIDSRVADNCKPLLDWCAANDPQAPTRRGSVTSFRLFADLLRGRPATLSRYSWTFHDMVPSQADATAHLIVTLP